MSNPAYPDDCPSPDFDPESIYDDPPENLIVHISFEQFHSKAKIAQRDRLPDKLRLTAGQRKALTQQRCREEQARKLLEMATKPEPKKKKKWRPNQQKFKTVTQ